MFFVWDHLRTDSLTLLLRRRRCHYLRLCSSPNHWREAGERTEREFSFTTRIQPVNGAARAFYSALATIVKPKHKFSPIMRTKAVPAGAPRLMFANWNPPNLMGTPGHCHRKQATGTLEQKAGCYGNEIGFLFSSHIGWYHNKAQPLDKA